jgi:hypothetical protein
VAERSRGGLRYVTAPVPFPRDRDPGVNSSSVCVDLGATEGAAARRQPGRPVYIDVPDTQYEDPGAPDGSPLPVEEAWEDIGSLCGGAYTECVKEGFR